MRLILLWLLILISVGLADEVNIGVLNESEICICRLSGNGNEDKVVVNFRGDAKYAYDPKTKDTFIPQMGYYVTMRSPKGVLSTQIVKKLDDPVILKTLGVSKSIPLRHFVKILKVEKARQIESSEDDGKKEKN